MLLGRIVLYHSTDNISILWYYLRRWGLLLPTQSVTVVSPSKTAEPIEMHAVWVVGSGELKKPCIVRGPDPLIRRGNFRGKGRPIVKYRDLKPCAVKNG